MSAGINSLKWPIADTLGFHIPRGIDKGVDPQLSRQAHARTGLRIITGRKQAEGDGSSAMPPALSGLTFLKLRGLVQVVPTAHPFNASLGVDHPLLTGIEGVALTAYLYPHVLSCRTYGEGVAAETTDR